MENEITPIISIAEAWKTTWQNKKSRYLLIIGGIVLIAILIYFPHFFAMIEQKEGSVINDALLSSIPTKDLSVPIFIVLWSTSFLILIRCIQNPSIMILFLWSFILITLSRFTTIQLFPLNPPDGLIPLKDPLTNFFYGGTDRFIRKDLFYSGHTSSQFLIFLTLTKKWDKRAALLSSLLIGTFVLVQHIHYTIDVLAAYIITYLIFRIAKKITATK